MSLGPADGVPAYRAGPENGRDPTSRAHYNLAATQARSILPPMDYADRCGRIRSVRARRWQRTNHTHFSAVGMSSFILLFLVVWLAIQIPAGVIIGRWLKAETRGLN